MSCNRAAFKIIVTMAAIAVVAILCACDDRGQTMSGGELPPHVPQPETAVEKVPGSTSGQSVNGPDGPASGSATTTPQTKPPSKVVFDATDSAVSPPTSRELPPRTQPGGPKKAWPRKMEVDAVTGYVKSPPPKVAHPPRIIAWYPIGNSDATVSNRMIGWNIKRDGWAGFINTYVEPAIKLGFDAVQLHNPGGTRPKEEMQADQFLDAKDDGIEWISRGFVDAWRPVTQRVQVIAYIGMLPKNDRYEGLLKAGDRAGFLQAVTDSYRMPLDARMDIAFDALHMVNPNGWELQVYRLFTAIGIKTYVETIPNVLDTTLYDANFQVVNSTLDRALLNGEAWLPALDQLSGERIVLLAEPPKGKTWQTVDIWLPGWLQHWIGQGWSVAINPSDLIKSRTRPWDLVNVGKR